MTLQADLAALCVGSFPDDAARILEAAPPDAAAELLASLPTAPAAAIAARMAPSLRAQCHRRLAPDTAARLVGAMAAPDAASVLRRLEPTTRAAVVAALPRRRADSLRRLLDFPAGTAGALMDPAAVALPPDSTAGDARAAAAERDEVTDVFVARREGALVGAVPIGAIMAAPDSTPLGDLAREVPALAADAPHEAVEAHGGWRTALSLPVVDRAGRFLGALDHRVVRRLADDRRGTRDRSPLTAVVSLAELYWLGATGITEGLARAAERRDEGGDDRGR